MPRYLSQHSSGTLALPRIGLALSGGGFRATLFHLGVIRFLRECELPCLAPGTTRPCAVSLLHAVTHVTSASGGSIMAAHLVANWHSYIDSGRSDSGCGDLSPFDRQAKAITAFCSYDVRNRILHRRLYPHWLTRFARHCDAQPEDRRDSSYLFIRYMQDHLFGDNTLHSLAPDANREFPRPETFLLATSLEDGAPVAFTHQHMHYDYPALGHKGGKHARLPCASLSIARAVAASAAFPAFFDPVPITHRHRHIPDPNDAPHTRFIDGGVADNLGIRAMTYVLEGKHHTMHAGNSAYGLEVPEIVLASDAELPFREGDGGSVPIVSRAVRATDLLMNRIDELETDIIQRTLATPSDLCGEVLVLNKAHGDKPLVRCDANREFSIDEHGLPSELRYIVPYLRTDFDQFLRLEMGALIQHGYYCAQAVLGAAARSRTVPSLLPWLPPHLRAAWDPWVPSGDRSGAHVSIGKHPIGGRIVLEDEMRSAVRAMEEGCERTIMRHFFFAQLDPFGFIGYVCVAVLVLVCVIPAAALIAIMLFCAALLAIPVWKVRTWRAKRA